MDYSQLPSDLRKPEEEIPTWYWSTRGKVIDVDKKRAVELKREEKIWRRVNLEEVKQGVKPGDYNQMYDKGVHKNIPMIIDLPTETEIGDVLECVLI